MATQKKRKKGGDDPNKGLLSVGDIGKIAGVPANTVHHWIARHDDFPSPVDNPTAGRLYRRGSVMAWLKKTKRT